MIIKSKDSAIFSGNIGKDPEEKLVGAQQKKIVNISVAVDKVGDDTIWVNAYAWGSMLSSLKKGDKVLMAGKKEVQTYTGQDGAEHTSEKIRVDFFTVMPRTESSSNEAQKPSTEVQTFEPIEDSELPF